MESWPLDQRRTMLAELQSMQRLEFLFSELNRYLPDVPSPPRRRFTHRVLPRGDPSSIYSLYHHGLDVRSKRRYREPRRKIVSGNITR
jgi:hypothetical protein